MFGFSIFFPYYMVISDQILHCFLNLSSQVGHTKGYIQVLVIAPESMLGSSAIVKITSVGRWSVFGEVIETLTSASDKVAARETEGNQDSCAPCSNAGGNCACSGEAEPCSFSSQTCCSHDTKSPGSTLGIKPSQENGGELRSRKNHTSKTENNTTLSSGKHQELSTSVAAGWGIVDRVLMSGVLVSSLTIMALLLYLGLRTYQSH